MGLAFGAVVGVMAPAVWIPEYFNQKIEKLVVWKQERLIYETPVLFETVDDSDTKKYIFGSDKLETIPLHSDKMLFYLFNVTNPKSIVEDGAKPAVTEVGPFGYARVVEKTDISFSGTGVVYFTEQAYFVPLERSENATDGCSLFYGRVTTT
jgi:hypothetical protein